MESSSRDDRIVHTGTDDLGSRMSGQRAQEQPITHAREGMDVLDVEGSQIGKVSLVRIGDPQSVTTEGQESDEARRGLLDDIVDVFAMDNEPKVPEELRAQLIREGYLKVDPGFLKGERYAFASQVERVARDIVRLKVYEDDLLKESSL